MTPSLVAITQLKYLTGLFIVYHYTHWLTIAQTTILSEITPLRLVAHPAFFRGTITGAINFMYVTIHYPQRPEAAYY